MGACGSKHDSPAPRKSAMSKRQNAIVEARLRSQQARQTEAYEKKRREGLEGKGEFARGIHDARQTDSHLNALSKTTHFSLAILRQLEVLFHIISGSQIQDEVIDREELSDALGLHSDSLLARTIFRLFDVTQSAKINFRTWVITLSSLSTMATPEEKVKFSFSLYDLNGDGSIEKEELKGLLEAAVKETLTDLSDDEVRELCEETLKSVDKDGNGLVDYDEYRQMVLRSVEFLECFSIDVERLLSVLQRQASRIGMAMNVLQEPAVQEREMKFKARKSNKEFRGSACDVLSHARELGGDENMTKVEAQEKIWAESLHKQASPATDAVWFTNGGLMIPATVFPEDGENPGPGTLRPFPVHLFPSSAADTEDAHTSFDDFCRDATATGECVTRTVSAPPISPSQGAFVYGMGHRRDESVTINISQPYTGTVEVSDIDAVPLDQPQPHSLSQSQSLAPTHTYAPSQGSGHMQGNQQTQAQTQTPPRTSISSSGIFPRSPSPHSPSLTTHTHTHTLPRSTSPLFHSIQLKQVPHSETQNSSRRQSFLAVPGSSPSRTPSGTPLPGILSMSGMSGIPVMVNSGHLRPGVLLHVPGRAVSNPHTPPSPLQPLSSDAQLSNTPSFHMSEGMSDSGKHPMGISPSPNEKPGFFSGSLQTSPNMRPVGFHLRSMSMPFPPEVDTSVDTRTTTTQASDEHAYDSDGFHGHFTVKIDLDNVPVADAALSLPLPTTAPLPKSAPLPSNATGALSHVAPRPTLSPSPSSSPPPHITPITASTLFPSQTLAPVLAPTSAPRAVSGPGLPPVASRVNSLGMGNGGGGMGASGMGTTGVGTISHLSRALNAHGLVRPATSAPVLSTLPSGAISSGTLSNTTLPSGPGNDPSNISVSADDTLFHNLPSPLPASSTSLSPSRNATPGPATPMRPPNASPGPAMTPIRMHSASPHPFTALTGTPVVFPRMFNDNLITLTPQQMSMGMGAGMGDGDAEDMCWGDMGDYAILYGCDEDSPLPLPPMSSIADSLPESSIPSGYVPHYLYVEGMRQPSIVYAPQFMESADNYVLYDDGHAEQCDVIEDLDLLGVEDPLQTGMDVKQANANAPALAKLLAKMRSLQDDEEE